MRTMLQLEVAGIVLALSCVGAEALPLGGQALDPYATFNEQSLTDNSASQATVGHSTPAMGPRLVGAMETHSVQPPRGGAETSTSQFILFVVTGVIVGLSAVAAIAVRIVDGLEFSPGGVSEQPPYALLRSNLAILDGLFRGYSRHETQT